MERKVRAARAQKADAQDDHSTLTQLMHDVRAAKEESERQLGKMRRMLEEAKRDWQKKMRDRKKEVQELKRRQERDELRELKRCASDRHSALQASCLEVFPTSAEFATKNCVCAARSGKMRRRARSRSG